MAHMKYPIHGNRCNQNHAACSCNYKGSAGTKFFLWNPAYSFQEKTSQIYDNNHKNHVKRNTKPVIPKTFEKSLRHRRFQEKSNSERQCRKYIYDSDENSDPLFLKMPAAGAHIADSPSKYIQIDEYIQRKQIYRYHTFASSSFSCSVFSRRSFSCCSFSSSISSSVRRLILSSRPCVTTYS